jgi:tellurium resistance protein TerD
MAIELSKGGKINLAKEAPALKRVRVGLGWTAQSFDNQPDYDLDVSAFGLKDEKLVDEKFFVFYKNKLSPDGAIAHSGDNRTGAGDGDDETIIVDLTKIDPAVDEVSFIVTIYEAVERKQNYGQVKKSYIKLYDDETGAVIGNYSLEDEFSTETAVQFGSLVRRESGWLFSAVGQGYNKGLADFVRKYGGEVA